MEGVRERTSEGQLACSDIGLGEHHCCLEHPARRHRRRVARARMQLSKHTVDAP